MQSVQKTEMFGVTVLGAKGGGKWVLLSLYSALQSKLYLKCDVEEK